MAQAILAHCQRFYDLLESKAEDTPEGKVFTGYITHTFNELNLSVPFYSRMTRMMTDMGCVKQLVRGGRAGPSKWLLVYRPSEASLADLDPDTESMTVKDNLRVFKAVTEQRLRDTLRTAKGAETLAHHLANAHAELLNEVGELKTQIQKLQQPKQK